MRILHVNARFDNHGGAERAVEAQCELLEKAGHPCAVITAAGQDTACSGFELFPIPASYGVRTARRSRQHLETALRSWQPDVVHLHNTQFFFSPWLIRATLSRYPVVKTVHDTRLICGHTDRWKVLPGTNRLCPYRLGWQCVVQRCRPVRSHPQPLLRDIRDAWLITEELRVSRRLDRLIVPSGYLHDQLLLNRFSPKRVRILPWFADSMSAPMRQMVDPALVLFVGRLIDIKGPLDFIRAMARQSQQLPWQAIMVGEGDLAATVDALIDRHGLQARVQRRRSLTRDALRRLYRQASLVVMPSKVPEAFGLVGIEAMAEGCPVVAYNAGGVNEWLSPDVTGLLVPFGDDRSLAAAVTQLLRDPTLADRLGRAGYDQVRRRFQRDLFLRRLLEIYAGVFGCRNSLRPARR